MNPIDELLGTNNKSNYNKDNWKHEQAEKRKKTYDIVENMTKEITTNSNRFKQYLDLQSKFSKYSIGNCLLILKNEPNATQIKDKTSWEEKGYSIIPNAKSITILEPNKVGTKLYYNPKEEYDISQTNAPMPEKITFTDKQLLQAFFNISDIKKELVDILPNGLIGSEYNKQENILYICRGLETPLLFRTLLQELANIEMKDEPDTSFKEFKSYCISYMLCKKYGIEVSKFDFNNLPSELTSVNEGKETRRKLDDIRTNFEKINTKIVEYFEQSVKEKKNKVQER